MSETSAPFLAILALGVIGACSEDPPTGACPGDPFVEPGTAPYDDPETFVPLPDGDTVTLVYGGQGGFHIWQSLRAGGVGRSCHVARRIERASDGAVLFDNAPGDRFDLVPGDGACLLEFAQPSFVCARDARDQDVFVEVGVDDGAATATGRVRARVACPPAGTDDGAGNDVGEICRTGEDFIGCE